jgi:hypothetical protein
MCALKRPFSGRDAQQLFANVIRGQFSPIPSRYGKNMKSLIDGMLNANSVQRPSAGDILKLGFIKSRIASKVRENEAQLKTVNIMASDNQRQKKKPVQAAKLPKLSGPGKKDICELPVPPDEEAPRWARRGHQNDAQKLDEVTVVAVDEDRNEYQDLRQATEKLQSSVTSDPVTDPVSIKERIAELRRVIERKIGKQLLAMLADYIQREDDPNCAQFVDIMTDQDQDVVEQIRDLISLENTFTV